MKRWSIWILLIFTGVFFYLTRGVLLPFLFGLAVAYFLDPLTDRLEAVKVPRGLAAGLVITLFFLTIVGVFVALWPIMQGQLTAAVETLPKAISSIKPWLESIMASLSESLDMQIEGGADGLVSGLMQEGLARLNAAAGELLKSGLAMFNLLTMMIISPVVAFYLLRDWDLIIAKADGWLPTRGGQHIREQAVKIDTVLAGFVRGQMMVCLVMGALYAIGWSVVGLKFSLLLGVLAGILAFVPFVGAVVAAAIALLIGYDQWGLGWEMAQVLAVYGVVQVIEGSYLTPKLVGDRVGLHPVWVLFAVFAGSEIMGFVGVLIAVPAAAAIAVMVRFWIAQYLDHYRYDEAMEVEENPEETRPDAALADSAGADEAALADEPSNAEG